MIDLRDYQIDLAAKGAEALGHLGVIYLSMQVRTGKTLTALDIARQYGARHVLFITKKRAIASIERDFDALRPGYAITVTNKESLHRIEGDFDLVVVDEAHQYGAFPKPAKYARDIKLRFGRLPMILLSGTPTPESYSQIYHQFWLSARSPFLERDFYTWARAYVNISQRDYGHGRVNDYSNAYWERIAPVIEPYMVRLTQEEAGFVNVINEHFIELEATPAIKLFAARLTNDLCFCGENWAITAETPVSLQQKLHQIYSGTVLYDEVIGEPRRGWILDKSKAYWILGFGKKVVIFYCFTKEWEAIKSVLGDRVTQDLDEFNSTDKSIALQIVSGREGLNLSKAEAIVYYNIAFSAVSYWQSRDRLTTIDRRESDCYYLFTKGGIEEKIYGAVVAKKDYTNTLFRRDFGIDRSKFPGKANPAVPGRGVPRGQNNSGQYQRVT